MKKTLSIILALVLIMSLATTAFAADATLTALGDSASNDVYAKYDDDTDGDTVYSVDIVWEDMTFTYKRGTAGAVWDPATHTYQAEGAAVTMGWDKTTATVTVTNHSNADVTVEFAYNEEANAYGVSGSMSPASLTLDAGVENKPTEADSDTSTLTISGTPSEDLGTEGKLVGTVTVTLRAA